MLTEQTGTEQVADRATKAQVYSTDVHSTASACRDRSLPVAVLGALFLSLIAVYQRMISPLLGQHCRFHPTCSTFAAQAIERYGPFGGLVRALKRISRCHPFSEGGYDPVR